MIISKAGAYFVTVCTWNRDCLFGQIENGEMLLNDHGRNAQERWHAIPGHFGNVETDEFIVMPNHVHGIVLINSANVGAIHELPLRVQPPMEDRQHRRQILLPKIIGRYKMTAAKRINDNRETPGVPVWQRNYYEHIIRDDGELHAIREYVRYNPAKWAEDKENPNMKRKQ